MKQKMRDMTQTIDDVIVKIQHQLGTIKHTEKSPSNFYLKTPNSKEHILLGYCLIDKKIRINEGNKQSLKLIDLHEIKTEKDLQDFKDNTENQRIQLMYLPEGSNTSYDNAIQKIIPRAKIEPVYFMQQLKEQNIALTDVVSKTYD